MTGVFAVIPVYNNGKTLGQVIRDVKKYLPDVIVADDGSTDIDPVPLCAAEGAILLRHARNLGKGAAIVTALREADRRGATNIITIDADGQHSASDIPKFLAGIERDPDALLVGVRDMTGPNVPKSSRFGCRFANFWMLLETGVRVADCQSGFRAYPVKPLLRAHFLSHHYNFEAEVLVRAVWGGLAIREIPISVFYPPKGERVTHFHPFRDNFRFTCIHFHLIAMRLLPLPKRRLLPKRKSRYSIFRPKSLFLALLKENSTPEGLGMSAAVGSFLAVLPIFGFHMLVIFYVTERFKLNKIMALAIQNLFCPPVSPFLCIELGYFMRTGSFLTDLTFDTLVKEIPFRLYEWFLGSLVLAPFWACVMGFLTCFIMKLLRRIKLPAKNH